MSETLPAFDEEGLERVLCVAAHPDDLEYGASAAVARWTARGVDVAYLLLTAGEAGMRTVAPGQAGPLRLHEQREACRAVGVEQLDVLDFPDGALEASLPVRKAIARRIREHRPDVVLTQTWDLRVAWGLNHADHRAAGLATVDAVRDADNPWMFPELAAQGLEPHKAARLLTFGGDAPTHLIDVSGQPFEQAVASLAAHEEYFAELGGSFDPRAMTEAFTTGAVDRGEDGVTHALAVAEYAM